MKNLCKVCKIAGIFVVIGAINWGLTGVFHFNLVETLFGEGSAFTRVIYALVGIAGVMFLVSYFKVCPKCVAKVG